MSSFLAALSNIISSCIDSIDAQRIRPADGLSCFNCDICRIFRLGLAHYSHNNCLERNLSWPNSHDQWSHLGNQGMYKTHVSSPFAIICSTI